MIGIINNVMSAYSVAEKIKKFFPYVSIYLYIEDNVDRGIDLLNNCNIIILPNNDKLSFYQEKYPEIVFLTLSVINSNGYVLDDDELLRAITSGNDSMVRELIEKKNIEDDVIILNNPKLLYIKSIIEDIYTDKKIIDNVDYLVELIKEYENLLEKSEGIIKVIGEREL